MWLPCSSAASFVAGQEGEFQASRLEKLCFGCPARIQDVFPTCYIAATEHHVFFTTLPADAALEALGDLGSSLSIPR